MRIYDRFKRSLVGNPWAWVFAALFLLAEYWNYNHASQRDQLCDFLAEGNENVIFKDQRYASAIIEPICTVDDEESNDDSGAIGKPD